MNQILLILCQFAFSVYFLLTYGQTEFPYTEESFTELSPSEVLSKCLIWRSSKCYSFNKKAVTYNVAKETCKQHGGKLASIPDQYTQDFIKSNFIINDVNEDKCGRNYYNQDHCHVWFDLFTKWRHSKDFFTGDEIPNKYSKWASGQPDLSDRYGSNSDTFCGSVNVNDGLWYDDDCVNYNNYFLCEREGTPCDLKQIKIPNAFFDSCHDDKDVPMHNQVQIQCNDGYVILGNKNVVCETNGQWSDFPSCHKVCPPPTLQSHSSIFNDYGEFDYYIGNSSIVLCDPGYVLDTDPTRSHFVITCTDKGTWDNLDKCVPVKKFQLISLIINNNNATVKLDCKLQNGSMAAKEWLWQKNSQAITAELGYSTNSNGDLVISTFESDHEGVYSCFALSPRMVVGLVSYDLKLQSVCDKISNSSVKRDVVEDDSLIINCAHPGIDAKSIAWIKDEEPLSQTDRVLILPDGSLVITKVVYSDKGHYSCNLFWNSGRCISRFSTELSVEASTLSLCGNSLKMTISPWTVSLYVEDEKTPFCYGALIHDKWVITSAYCMLPFYRKRSLKIFVRFGQELLDFDGPFPDDGDKSNSSSNKIQYVEFMKIHPLYSPRLFANDVALVRLKDRISFSDDVQPICLTDKDFTKTLPCETNLLVQGLVSGWGHLDLYNPENAKFKTENMSVVATSLCNGTSAAASAMRFTDTICATQNTSEVPIYAANIGSPFVVEYQNRVYLLGIFILGERYSRLGNNDYFTKISKYSSWIRSTIA